MLHNGLYEQIINKGLDTELSTTDKLSQTAPIDSAEASKVLAKYAAGMGEKESERKGSIRTIRKFMKMRTLPGRS